MSDDDKDLTTIVSEGLDEMYKLGMMHGKMLQSVNTVLYSAGFFAAGLLVGWLLWG